MRKRLSRECEGVGSLFQAAGRFHCRVALLGLKKTPDPLALPTIDEVGNLSINYQEWTGIISSGRSVSSIEG